MQRIFNDKKLKKKYRYSAHGFVDKLACRPCQAADLLAWQSLTDFKRDIGKPRRLDYVSLLKLRHIAHVGDANEIHRLNSVTAKAMATALKF